MNANAALKAIMAIPKPPWPLDGAAGAEGRDWAERTEASLFRYLQLFSSCASDENSCMWR